MCQLRKNMNTTACTHKYSTLPHPLTNTEKCLSIGYGFTGSIWHFAGSVRQYAQTFRKCYSLILLSSSLWSTILIFVCSWNMLCCGSRADVAKVLPLNAPDRHTSGKQTLPTFCLIGFWKKKKKLWMSQNQVGHRGIHCGFSIRPARKPSERANESIAEWSQAQKDMEWYAVDRCVAMVK